MSKNFTEWQHQALQLADVEGAVGLIQGLVSIPPGGDSAEERLAALLRIRSAWRVPESSTDPAGETGLRVREHLRNEAYAIGSATANLVYSMDSEICRLLAAGAVSEEVI